MEILLITTIIIFNIYYVKRIYYLLNIYQQNHYDIKKYMKSIKKYYFSKIHCYLYYLSSILLVTNLFLKSVTLYIVAIILILIGVMLFDKYIIKLKFTKRIIRLIFTIAVILSLINMGLIIIGKELLCISLGIIMPFIIIISAYINLPIENLIKKKYKQMAINKLERCPNLIKIAITGSFGKTSTKNILYHILSSKYLVTKTPKSYNTMMGLSLTINKELNTNCEIFIVEMGAFKKGEIKEMAMAIKPDMAIITEIGPQHLSTFKTIDNIVDAKFEIATNLKGPLILNFDNKYIKKKINDIKIEYESFGFSGSYFAKNIKYHNNETLFDICKQEEKLVTIKTKLLGKHNVSNILCAYATIKKLKSYGIEINDDEFSAQIERLEPLEHRLSYNYLKPFHIYDDSYSSNLSGFKNALEVLKKQKAIRCIITPGIVDGGKKEEELNLEIAKHLTSEIEEIYIIKNNASLSIIKFFEENKISCKVFSNFNDAYKDLTEKYKQYLYDVHILIENDLPDSFLER